VAATATPRPRVDDEVCLGFRPALAEMQLGDTPQLTFDKTSVQHGVARPSATDVIRDIPVAYVGAEAVGAALRVESKKEIPVQGLFIGAQLADECAVRLQGHALSVA